ncbi:MAG TPA: GTPase ObgE [Solirubrobacteraceae bacterium]
MCHDLAVLYDRAQIHVEAGGGGDGSVSFRREAHVPKGGPDGGDGGRGGDVVLICDDSLRDLHQLKRSPHRRAPRGGHGQGALRHGADGEDLIVRVPPGTQAVGQDGDLAGRSYDLTRAGQRAVLARGGSGGRGNKHFATSTRQAPRFGERGLRGEQGSCALQLKLLADVGLVGLPNAGKSSLLSRLTRAQPKIANYPFTTLEPVLGVIDDGERQIVVADIPGLIEGASDGAGLGHDFLGHVERCRLLVHVLDLHEGEAMLANHETIEHELGAYDSRLTELPRVLVLSKSDLITAEQAQSAVEQWSKRLGEDVPVLAASSATRHGLAELSTLLLHQIADALASDSAAAGHAAVGGAGRADGRPSEDLAEHMIYRPAGESGFSVQRLRPGSFAVRGHGIERLVQRFDANNEEAMAHLEVRLRRIGVIGALEGEGFTAGDEIEIAGIVFELDPESPA